MVKVSEIGFISHPSGMVCFVSLCCAIDHPAQLYNLDQTRFEKVERGPTTLHRAK